MKVAQSCPTPATPQTVQSMGFSRAEYWSGEPIPSPGDLPDPGIKPRFPTLQADSLPFFIREESTGKYRYDSEEGTDFFNDRKSKSHKEKV